jgi:hypothetical protein
MSAMWEVQKALYDALKANSNFMNLVENRLYDEPSTNDEYPYVVLGEGIETTDNRLAKKGFNNLIIFSIYTKPFGLGYYTAKNINEEIFKTLDHKRLPMTNYTMVICKYENAVPEKEEDKRILHSRFRVIAHDENFITY